MGNTLKTLKVSLRDCRSAINYQCRVCTADSETADELDADPTKTMSGIGRVDLLKPPPRYKYF